MICVEHNPESGAATQSSLCGALERCLPVRFNALPVPADGFNHRLEVLIYSPATDRVVCRQEALATLQRRGELVPDLKLEQIAVVDLEVEKR